MSADPDKNLKPKGARLTTEEEEVCRRFHFDPVGYLKWKKEGKVYPDERGAWHVRFPVPERIWPATTEDAMKLGKAGQTTWQVKAEADANEQNQTAAVPKISDKPKLSKLEKHVLLFLIDRPHASAQDVCAHFDRQDIQGPKGWYPGGRLPGPGEERELRVIYANKANSAIKNRIDKCVSKVRAYQEKYL